MRAMVARRAKGMLKEDIAAQIGKRSSWVAFPLCLRGLRSGIQQILNAAPLSVQRQFGLVYLMRLPVMEPELQNRAFDEA